MRQVGALVAGALLAALGAVVLGEYPLEGTTALIGFPLYGVAVAELALAIGKRLSVASLAAVAAIVASGLAWALWISYGHFRNGVHPPSLSWAMVGVAGLAAVAWGWPRRRSGGAVGPDSGAPAVTPEGWRDGVPDPEGPALRSSAGQPAAGGHEGVGPTAGPGGAANGPGAPAEGRPAAGGGGQAGAGSTARGPVSPDEAAAPPLRPHDEEVGP